MRGTAEHTRMMADGLEIVKEAASGEPSGLIIERNARLQSQMIEELLDVFPARSLGLAPGFEWVCVDHIMEYGPEHLPVVVAR